MDEVTKAVAAEEVVTPAAEVAAPVEEAKAEVTPAAEGSEVAAA